MLVMSLLLTGCYPVYKQVQPATMVTVVDAAGTPVSDARVTLITKARPATSELGREQAVTGSDGVAGFAGRREWQVESMMLHGWKDYYWVVCVSKSGFETHTQRKNPGRQNAGPLVITLLPGTPSDCPSAEQ